MDRLLQQCVAARRSGADFPTVWNTILRNHPFVAGQPVQAIEDGAPVLKVPLVTGHHLVFGPDGYSIE